MKEWAKLVMGDQAEIAVRAVRAFIAGHPDDLDVVMWVLFAERTEAANQAEKESYGRDK